ncbi:thioredoxin family protein [Abyssicoccus albus]|uniref:Thioredoxin n=1 Tax=Abyssicoccus albus TaxID=1817405 RepID=A0A1Q1G2R8_9BACL|nr:thioredoxin family protein [Abyssicoccus albus]AQL56653.1 thiol reductase thioredoxin [Abyssicoccus albus]RPF57530.1 thioredoxin [Abyssicoccus albus]
MKEIKELSQFNDIIQSEQPVIIKFYATWCPDCTVLNNFIGPVVEQYNDYEWYEVNRDELMEPAQDYEVMGIPSLLIFKDGDKIAHLHSRDAKTKEQVETFLQAHL